MGKKDLIKITTKEYDSLKIYENDAKEIMKFLAKNHHDIYMKICNSKLSRYIPKNVKSIKIDGKKIKENTYYQIKNGKFVEWKK